MLLLPDMTYNVFGGTLNPTLPLLIGVCLTCDIAMLCFVLLC